MNKHHRDQKDMKMNMSGDKKHSSSSENSAGFAAVNAMVSGKHPTTNLETIKCGGNSSEKMGASIGVKKMAAGGVGKMRHQEC